MRCGMCGSTRSFPVLKSDKFRLVECLMCGLVYTDYCRETPSLYADKEYFVDKNQYINRWNEFRLIFEDLITIISSFKPRGSLLDVGAGVGILASVAVERGFYVQGVEISGWAASYAREEKGLDILEGTLESIRLGAKSFDIIVVNHVLEHISDLHTFLAEVRRVLKDDGLLVVGVPNFDSIMATLRGSQWPSLRPEEHLWHFTPRTLRRLLCEAGFTERYFSARFMDRLSGWGYKIVVLRIVNRIAFLVNRSEAMLILLGKK